MTLEFLLWLIAWFVVSEIIFVVFYIFFYDKEEWIRCKGVGFLLGGFFVAIHALFIFVENEGITTSPNYIYLLYELIIILAIIAVFGLNKLIAVLIDNVNKKKGRKK